MRHRQLLLGVWQVVSPFALGFARTATWITSMLGLFVILFAAEELLLGLTRLVAPWKVGYEPVSAAVNSMVSGILVILFAACGSLDDLMGRVEVSA